MLFQGAGGARGFLWEIHQAGDETNRAIANQKLVRQTGGKQRPNPKAGFSSRALVPVRTVRNAHPRETVERESQGLPMLPVLFSDGGPRADSLAGPLV